MSIFALIEAPSQELMVTPDQPIQDPMEQRFSLR
jgi:hypothetical protein